MVTREYYFNDHGAQIDRFSRSLIAAAKGEPAPEDGYAGAYIADIAASVLKQRPDVMDLPADEQQETFRAIGVELMFTHIKQTLHDFGVDFDVYFHENSLFESGAVEKAVESLKGSGNLFHEDGAWWLKSTDYGDDKDRVVIKSDGNAAYIAGDIAYFQNKRARGFDLCIYMLGADHHGYIGRLKAAAAAFGDDPDTVEVLIGQMVNLVKDGTAVKMSKRAGTVITLDDLVEAIGVDASRYVMIRSSVDSSIDIDLDLWTKTSSENPVYYVQYAHARLSAIARNAADLGLSADASNLALLTVEQEGDLIRTIGEYPRVVSSAANLREPHRIARYLEELAGAYHRFYGACRILPQGDEDATDVHRARLALCAATRQVLANGSNCSASPHRSKCERAPRRPQACRAVAAPGLPDRPTSPEAFGELSPQVWPRNASRGDDGEVTLAGVKVGELAEKYGTPLFVIDEDDFRSRCRDMARAFGPDARCTTHPRHSSVARSHAGSPTKASRSTSAPAANWRSRCTRTSRPSELPCTATTSQSPNWPLVSPRASDTSCSTRRSRSTDSIVSPVRPVSFRTC